MENVALRLYSFDLKMSKLDELNVERSGAYRQIEHFFTNNNFSHPQGSGYISNAQLSNYENENISKSLFREIPWLEQCANSILVSDISNQSDILTHRRGMSTSFIVENTTKQLRDSVDYDLGDEPDLGALMSPDTLNIDTLPTQTYNNPPISLSQIKGATR